jgi:ATP-dependent helicase/nuclease subunit B
MPPRIHGAFYLIAPRWVNGPLAIEKFPEEGWEDPYKERLQATLSFLLKGIREGRFFIFPDDHCKNCEVRAACRRNHRPSLWRAGNDSAVRYHGELNEQKAPALQGRRGS